MLRQIFAAAILAQLCFCGAARADGYFVPQVAAGPLLGTTGIGVQATVPLLPGRLDLTSGFGTFGLTRDVTVDGTRFHGKLRLGGVPLFLSVFPFANCGLHLDAGVVFNDNQVSANAAAPPAAHFTINGHRYGAAQIGTLYGRTHFSAVAPYLGLGYGDPFRGGPLSFTINVGVMFEGDPNIHLAASNPAVLALPGAAQDIRKEQRSLNDKASFARFFPVLTVGVVYRFG